MAGKRRKGSETPPASEVVDDDPIGANAPETEAERALRIDREAAERKNATAEDDAATETDDGERGQDDEPDDEDDAKGEDGAAVEAAAAPPAPAVAETRKVAEPAKLRARLGEPPPVDGAIVDKKTGRVEVPAPGTFDAKRRPPQRP